MVLLVKFKLKRSFMQHLWQSTKFCRDASHKLELDYKTVIPAQLTAIAYITLHHSYITIQLTCHSAAQYAV